MFYLPDSYKVRSGPGVSVCQDGGTLDLNPCMKLHESNVIFVKFHMGL